MVQGKFNKYVRVTRTKHKRQECKPIHVITNSCAVADKLQTKESMTTRKIGLYDCQATNGTSIVETISKKMGEDMYDAARRHVAYTRDGMLDVGGTIDIGNIEHEGDDTDDIDERITMDENGHWERLGNNAKWVAYDDVTGTTLCPEKVKIARQEELEYFKHMHVYDVVKREVATSKNKKIIGVRWIDINKGDNNETNYRSRLVGKEFNQSACPELFAATPPIEALKVLLHIAATTTNGKVRKSVMINDIKRAYFHAPALREVYIELPPEDERRQHGYIGILRKSLYGTRDAALNWQTCIQITLSQSVTNNAHSPHACSTTRHAKYIPWYTGTTT